MTIDEWLKADRPWNIILHGDCMELMQHLEDKSINLACVDPPYGIGERLSQGAGKLKNSALQNMNSEWDVLPDEKYFNELFRIAKNQIIWGGNYFNLSPTRGIICWDKKQYMPTFSRWEMAWTSFDCPAKMYEKIGNETRVHPTQKPVALYRWLLQNYAKPGDKIIDTHSGSGSCAIACHIEKHDFLAIEKDPDYHAASVKRLEEVRAQGVLF